MKQWQTVAVILALALRIALVVYGEWHDAQKPLLKYTDIDYQVFTDAAKFLRDGQSPFLRATYRYTPILAYLMLWTGVQWGWTMGGKLLFVSFDMICAWFIHGLAKSRCAPVSLCCELSKYMYTCRDSSFPVISALIWLWNPMGIAISTRGSAESVLCAMVLGCFYALSCRQTALGAILLGLATHFKIYPIIYAIPIMILLDSRYCNRSCAIINKERIQFAAVSATTFIGLTFWMYTLFGQEFLDHAYLYHIGRRDHRHNFSVYYYSIYLSFDQQVNRALGLVTFLPQMIVVTLSGILYGKDLVFAAFLQTFAFVMFNKVITSQYFMWYLCFVPLLLPRLRLSKYDALKILALWIGGQAFWLSQAYRLEMLGQSVFFMIWLAGIVLFLWNSMIFTTIVRHYSYAPQFSPSNKNKKS